MKKNKTQSFLFFLPFLTCFILFWAIPFFYGFYLSFRKMSMAKGDGGFIGLDNFARIFDTTSTYNQLFFLGMKNTITFVCMSVIPLVVIALILALIIDNLPEKLKRLYRTIFFVSYVISVTTVSAIFAWLFNGNGGYINNVLMSLNLIKSPILWLEAQPFAWISITISTVWWTIGYNMMLFINALNEVDPSIHEAADLDGASFFKKFLYIIFPNIKSVFFFVLMTTIISSFNLYGQSRLMTSGNPAQSTQSIIFVIQDVVFKMNNLAMGSVMAILMGIVVMIFSVLQYYLTKEKKLIKEVSK